MMWVITLNIRRVNNILNPKILKATKAKQGEKTFKCASEFIFKTTDDLTLIVIFMDIQWNKLLFKLDKIVGVFGML